MITRIYKNIFVGDWKDAETRDDFDVKICVAEDIKPEGDIKFPLYDGFHLKNANIFALAVCFVHHIRTKFSKILIYCGAGISRSPAVIAGVMVIEGNKPETVWKNIKSVYPIASPEPYFKTLVHYVEEIRDEVRKNWAWRNIT